MLMATIGTTEDELLQIHLLNQQNLEQNLDKETQHEEGFVTCCIQLNCCRCATCCQL